MTSGQKVAFSLLISVLAFCAFAVVAFSGLFDLLEVNFYQPVVQEVKQKKIEEIAAAQNEYFQTLMKRFDAFSLSSDVKTYALSRPDDVAVRGRERLRSELVTSTAALSGIRIVDDNGRNIYFSTYSSDIISDKKGISYRNYNASDELNYDSVRSKNLFQASSEDRCRIIKDGQNKRIIFSLPFYNPENEYKGSILFYCNPLHFSQFLYNRNLIDVKGFAELVTAPMDSDKFVDGFGGFVFGLPNYGQESIKSEILEKWRAGDDTFWKLQPVENPDQAAAPDKSGFYDMDAFLGRVKSNSLCAFSYKHAREDFGFITLLYGENELKFPPYIRVLLLATAFVTLYLAIFLILSFKHDDVVIIRDKIRRYESEFFIGYKKNGENRNGAYLLEQKEILEKRILKSLGKRGEKHAAEFKAIFESSWQEFSAQFLGAPAVTANLGPAFNAAELKEIVRSSLEDILENGKIQINAATVISSSEQKEIQNPDSPVEAAPAKVSTEVTEAEDAEEIEEIPEAEDAEEIEEIEELSGANSEADVSEELEPITDMSEELRFGDGRMPSIDDGDTDFSAVGEEALKQKFEEELEMLPEVSEREERAIDIAKTLEALPEHAPHLDDDDDELDSAGLSRKPSFAERHDIAKLRDAVRSVEKMDTNLEELEPIDAALPEEEPEQSPSKTSNGSEQNTKILSELLDTDFYLPHLFDNNIYADDDVYKDEALLEKIEFGVPTTEIHDEVYDESVAENFVAFPLDYSSLDEDDADEKMYEEEPADDDKDSLLFFENHLVESDEKKQKETLENTEESAENQTTALEDELPALESVVEDDAEEVVTLDSPEENMPFMFTKFSLDADTQVVELSPVMSDAIVQDADGTFRVTEFTHPENVTLDADFKKLVDSILR